MGRSSFAAHYDFGERYIYLIGGTRDNEGMIADCEYFDTKLNRWHEMPSLNEPRSNPGVLISNDKQYMYVFWGFINVNSYSSKTMGTIERIELANISKGWEFVEVSRDSEANIASFVIYPLRNLYQLRNEYNVDELDDKYLFVGGWKPYQNLKDLQIFDLKEMKFEALINE